MDLTKLKKNIRKSSLWQRTHRYSKINLGSRGVLIGRGGAGNFVRSEFRDILHWLMQAWQVELPVNRPGQDGGWAPTQRTTKTSHLEM